MKINQRFFRFSLKASLVLLTILCVWLGKISVDARKQREAVEWVRKHQGEVRYDTTFDRRTAKYAEDSSSVPKWLQELLGEDYFRTVSHVTIFRTRLNDISPLVGLKGLRELELISTEIKGVAPLARLTHLTHLSLARNHIEDLAPLQRLTRLVSLNVADNKITDISPLSALKNLTSLMAGDNKIRTIAPLKNLHSLEHLYLPNNLVSDLSVLSGLPNLERVDVKGNPVDAKEARKYPAIVN